MLFVAYVTLYLTRQLRRIIPPVLLFSLKCFMDSVLDILNTFFSNHCRSLGIFLLLEFDLCRTLHVSQSWWNLSGFCKLWAISLCAALSSSSGEGNW